MHQYVTCRKTHRQSAVYYCIESSQEKMVDLKLIVISDRYICPWFRYNKITAYDLIKQGDDGCPPGL